MKSSNFDIGVFANLNRLAIIQLENYGSRDANKITYLLIDRKVFQPFYDINEENIVNVQDIDCLDCRNYWLVEKNDYSNKLFGISCSNYQKIADLAKNFKGCNSSE